MKIAVITCYHDPEYVRARTIRAALGKVPGITVVEVKNSFKGPLRYPQVVWRLWKTNRAQHPDAYVLTFRGQEILPLVQLFTRGKPLIFDELIIPIAYASNENHAKTLKIRVFYALARFSESFYKSWLRKCRFVLADTKAHAELSARTSDMNLSSYVVVPVGTDEKAFKPAGRKLPKAEKFQVFYYSTGMQPLHGIEYVLQAAESLSDHEDIEFLIVGGKKLLRDKAAAAAKNGARVRYQPWIPFDELVSTMYASGLCLGGPFGGTNQAQHVITTKTYQMLASAVPTLIGDSEATREYFIDKENALVIPQADAEAIKRAILWAQKHPLDLKQMALSGRKTYDKHFSTAALAKIWQTVVADL